MRRTWAVLAFLAGCAGPWGAELAEAAPRPKRPRGSGPVLAPVPPTPQAPEPPPAIPPPPEWRWRQILSVPRIGGRLRAIAVDPRDPRRVYVGTEEGTLLLTEDGGVTWGEVELRPTQIAERSLGLEAPGLPDLGQESRNNFETSADPPDVRYTDRYEMPSVADPFPVRPGFFFAGFTVRGLELDESLLAQVTDTREDQVEPVKRIALCPGGRYPLLVATTRDIFGALEDGTAFVRLFANPGPVDIATLACAPGDPNMIAVATGVGLFYSRDGGLTFDQDLSAWPGQEATAVAFMPGRGRSELFVASDSELYGGDVLSPVGLGYVYPSDDPETAPWLTIRSIAVTGRGEVWLGTDDGARHSADGGKTWRTLAGELLSRQPIGQVALGESERGGTRAALLINTVPLSLSGEEVSGLHDSVVYSTDDGGATWHPFFHGLSRRSFRQLATVPASEGRPAGWWLVTSGEVWTTYPAEAAGQADEVARDWARRRLERTPSLSAVLTDTLEHLDLSNASIGQLASRHRTLNWVPRLDLLFELSDGALSAFGVTPFSRNRVNAAPRVAGFACPPLAPGVLDAGCADRRTQAALFVQATWELYDLLIFKEETDPIRTHLHELRRQVAFTIEDAWHERVTHLATLNRGLEDPLQIETLKTRVFGLEAMIAVWLGHALPDLEPEAPGGAP